MQTSNDDERRLSRAEAAAFLSERGFRVAYATLNKYASIGGGPVFESFGRRPLYTPSNLLAWAAQKSSGPRRSTSDAGKQQVALLGVGGDR